MRRIINIETKELFEIEVRKAGENSITCPACSNLHPKSAKRKCMSWNDQKRTGKCHRCEVSFVEYKPIEKKETYFKPQFNDKTELSELHLKYFQGRMISNEALNFCKVYSTREFMPQHETEVSVVAFPFFRDGQLVNVKYRGPQKSFKLVKGAEKILFNVDAIKSAPMAVIVEGEIDALSYITAGIKFVVSVPNGAGTNLEYMDSAADIFENLETVVLAVDTDAKGVELKQELARRIGVEKCKVVDFKDCKDANEFLVKYGAPELFRTIQAATDYPVTGVFAVDDLNARIENLWANGLVPGKPTYIPEIDNLITWEVGRVAIVTGVPGHGKSEVLDFIISKLNFHHGWKVGVFSPENYPLELHCAKLSEKFIGKEFSSKWMTLDEYDQVTGYINNNYWFIVPEENYTLDTILEKAKHLVRRSGIKILVIDPFNRLEHRYDGNQTDYISLFLDKLSNFAMTNGVLVFLVAHPAKMQQEGGKVRVPTLYDISGSSNFFNKADYGFTVYRKGTSDGMTNETEIYVQKVKFKHLGRTGKAKFVYNYRNGRFEPGTTDGVNGWDNSNWLAKESANRNNDEIPF